MTHAPSFSPSLSSMKSSIMANENYSGPRNDDGHVNDDESDDDNDGD